MPPFLHYILPTRNQSFMLDLVISAMAIILIALAWSIRLARKGSYQTHKRLQWTLTTILVVVIVAFEIDMRLNGWSDGVTASGEIPVPVGILLAIHIICSVLTLFFWGVAMWTGHQVFKEMPAPVHVREKHRGNGYKAALGLLATTVTGWAFYILAFIVDWDGALPVR